MGWFPNNIIIVTNTFSSSWSDACHIIVRWVSHIGQTIVRWASSSSAIPYRLYMWPTITQLTFVIMLYIMSHQTLTIGRLLYLNDIYLCK
jgi:hypothetical protein